MEQALSLVNGKYLLASSAGYSSSKELLLVCPECGEPVYYKSRQIPHITPFFAHYQELASIKLVKGCSLRVFGARMQNASKLIPGISHGQLVDRFQKDFCLELHKILGKTSSQLISFLKASEFLNLSKKDYKDFVDHIEKSKLFFEISLYDFERSDFNELYGGKEDVCSFLRSQYGIAVGNFIYQTSYFLACIIHPDSINSSLGNTLYYLNSSKAIFVIEPFRLKNHLKYADEILAETDKRNKAIPQIASALIALLMIKWRRKNAAPKLLVSAENIDDGTNKKVFIKTKLPNNINLLPIENSKINKEWSNHFVSNFDSSKNLDISRWQEPVKNIDPSIKSNTLKHSSSHQSILARVVTPNPNSYRSGYQKPINVYEKTSANFSSINSYSVPKEKNDLRVPGNENINASIKEINKSNLNESNAKNYSNIYEYSLDSTDYSRINSLIERSKRLSRVESLHDRESVILWAKEKNSIEAYFLASFLKIPHESPNFADGHLTAKLNAWLLWANKKTS